MHNRIIIYGMSCVGKTTFAKTLHLPYVCFDALFPWHEVESFGLSTSGSLSYVREQCQDEFVLDGWHTSDLEGKYHPKDVTIYCLYSTYDFIINQYRIPVPDQKMHLPMYKKWYSFDYTKLNASYWFNDGEFKEMDKDHFKRITGSNFGIQANTQMESC